MYMLNYDFLRQEVKVAVKEALQEFNAEAKVVRLTPAARYLTRSQTAEYLGISEKTVDLWARTGKLKRSYIKGSPRFDREWIDQSFDDLKKYKRTI